MNLDIVRTVSDLRATVAAWRMAGEIIGLVPTMGALHDGHLSLVSAARTQATRVVATIFVNPKQFAAGEDLDCYPRDEAGDAAALAAAGCDLLFAPSVTAVYPAGFATQVRVPGLSDVLDGVARPGHFDGVATVVTKLLNMVGADAAFFGEKDWQQLAIIRRLAADLDIATAIVGCPVVRAADGLALSSRNAYLTADERADAVALPVALHAAARALVKGVALDGVLIAARAAIAEAGFGQVDYVTLTDAASLRMLERFDRPARLLGAAWIGRTRLIDNVPVP